MVTLQNILNEIISGATVDSASAMNTT